MAAELTSLPVSEKKFPITGPRDVTLAQQTARSFARALAFDEVAGEEIAIAASELASNLVKHARGGTLTFTAVYGPDRVGLSILSKDNGPNIPDIERAVTDGFSTTGSLGYGLGTINRLMDDLEITSLPGQGTCVACSRWLRASGSSLTTTRCLDFGAASRAYRQGTANGDSYVFRRWEKKALAGLIDGLGHGEPAQEAALAARQYIERHYDQPLAQIFRGAGRACRSTRGVVMALAQFDLEAERFSCASIGNIEARVLGGSTPSHLLVRRGIVGIDTAEPALSERPWHGSDLLVLHSDGLTTRWSWNDFPNLALEPATFISRRLLQALDKGEDDATVVVVKGIAA
jgi:anti-sigma regulatory factor (Ser/Thr protein kinase)/serine/threonine protein phosphatase PrpC